jgi:hypothetical protein
MIDPVTAITGATQAFNLGILAGQSNNARTRQFSLNCLLLDQ